MPARVVAKLTHDDYDTAIREGNGICIYCKEFSPADPDTYRALCNQCGRRRVYSLPILLEQKQIKFVDQETKEGV